MFCIFTILDEEVDYLHNVAKLLVFFETTKQSQGKIK